jgi:hypothetical protein
MSNTLFAILTDSSARSDAAVEHKVLHEADIAWPWFDKEA